MLKAKFSYQIFLSDDGSYSVNHFIVKECGEEDCCEVGDTITVVGNDVPTFKNVTYILMGKWEANKRMKGNMQFKFMGYQEDIPQNKNDILNYLSSGIIKGIGKKNAVIIYEAFGSKSLEILEREPERLLELKGFGQKNVQMISDSYSTHLRSKDSLLFLSQVGIDVKTGKKIFDKFKEDTEKLVRENPYCLTQVKGISFDLADLVFAKMGGTRTDKRRIEAAILWALYLLEHEEGNTGSPVGDLESKLYNILKVPRTPEYQFYINQCSKEMIKDKKVIISNSLCFRPQVFDMETECASHIVRILNGNPFHHKKNMKKVIEEAQKKKNIILDPIQEEAVVRAVKENLLVITGGPGCGKTTTINVIIEVFKELFPKKSIRLMAPTGRASRRMTESTGIPASTIHSSLRISIDKDSDMSGEELEEDIFIVDEVSMLDLRIATLLLRAVDDGKKLILIGDADQLPSVDPGAVLRDLIASNVIGVVKLNTVFRQKEDSSIYVNSIKIRNGETDIREAKDFRFVEVADFEEAAERMNAFYREKVGKYGIDHVACLTPYRKYVAGSEYMNKSIQSYINPDVGQNTISFRNQEYRETDIVMNLVNAEKDGNYVSNGDIGTIEKINNATQTVTVNYFGNTYITYEYEELEELDLGYSYTIHKSQGSEYDCVISCLCDQHIDKMKTRNILYTVLTRAKKEFVIVGSREAIEFAINHVTINARKTLLAEKIRLFNKKYSILS